MTIDAVNAGKRATITDVARAAGVSRATVSRVMNGISTVDASIAERVLATASELEYAPSGTARSLSLGVTQTVAMMVPDLGNPMFQEILKGFHHAAGADGYRVLVSDSQEVVADEVAIARDARRRCDAVVLCAPRSSGEALVELLRTVQPAVVINRSTQGGVAPAVTIDYAAGIRSLVDHLVALGHRRLAYLEGPPQSASNVVRMETLEKMKQERDDLEIHWVPCGSTLVDGYRAWPDVQSTGATAVIAFNDLVALGFLGRLNEESIAVPADLSVAGFDDIPFSRFSSPPLTTVTIDQVRIGEVAWQKLRAAIDRGEEPSETRFRPDLVVRASTGPAR
ncbi:LacI family DNA-binding transcriptional regulator [Microbacterium sp. DT81.1]|uniref:LacI family DNA-binding transcriptional regulator n=1 Tax=Microbacterium sp. DT81.1 TaxID=3393413 RepID=UPI003CE7EB6A